MTGSFVSYGALRLAGTLGQDSVLVETVLLRLRRTHLTLGPEHDRAAVEADTEA